MSSSGQKIRWGAGGKLCIVYIEKYLETNLM